MSGGPLNVQAPAAWAASSVPSWAAAGASAGWTSRAAARIHLNANQAATGAAGTFTVLLNTLNAAIGDAAGFAQLGSNALVVPTGYAGTYLANWGLFYTGGLGTFSQLVVNGTAVANGSGSTRSVGASILALAQGDTVTLKGTVTATEVFGGGAAGTDSWLALVRYQ